ncbi:DegT/DnrJ/EryC1/StrS family aminotransferase [candidate division KSB1 bacterium]
MILEIPFFNIDKIYRNNSKEILAAVNTVFSHGHVLMGPEIDEFEEKTAKLCGRDYGVAVGSCTDALYFALSSAGITKGDEVLVTSYTFIASVTPILRIGAIPVFVDIEPDYYMMDLSDLENKITGKTKAIVAVHLFGQTLNFERVEEIAAKNNLILIEDAAQSFGSSSKERKAGSMGLFSCISFDPTKVIGAFGNGGILLTDDEKMCSTVKKLRYHGKNLQKNTFEILGYNSRIATSQAALLNLQLKWLKNWIEKRNEVAEKYNKNLSGIDAVTVPVCRENSRHIYHKYVLKAEDRDQLRKYLSENGIKTLVHYKNAVFENELFSKYCFTAENINVVHEIKDKVISLPVYPELTDNEILHITDSIRKFYS